MPHKLLVVAPEQLTNEEINALVEECKRNHGLPQKIPIMRLLATVAEVPALRANQRKRAAPKKRVVVKKRVVKKTKKGR